jgi:hypothetical protein
LCAMVRECVRAHVAVYLTNCLTHCGQTGDLRSPHLVLLEIFHGPARPGGVRESSMSRGCPRLDGGTRTGRPGCPKGDEGGIRDLGVYMDGNTVVLWELIERGDLGLQDVQWGGGGLECLGPDCRVGQNAFECRQWLFSGYMSVKMVKGRL